MVNKEPQGGSIRRDTVLACETRGNRPLVCNVNHVTASHLHLAGNIQADADQSSPMRGSLPSTRALQMSG